ncbi:hypothetical protein B566_EDAN001039 [Ephemera danica]|nr:hypothetical protein B566_EDAN001039 [Ephemera danica]
MLDAVQVPDGTCASNPCAVHHHHHPLFAPHHWSMRPCTGTNARHQLNRITAKIRNLHDYQLRLLHGIMPMPSGMDIANTIKNFSQILLSVLKDVPRSPLEMLKVCDQDAARLALFPNLDYKGFIWSSGTSMSWLLTVISGCGDDRSTALFSSQLHGRSSKFFTSGDRDDNYASQSVSAILMMVFQFSSNSDLLCIMAFGTSGARNSAAKLLFYYWPPFNISAIEKRTPTHQVRLARNKGADRQLMRVLQFNYLLPADWPPLVCQRDMCPNAGIAEAAKVCFDHGASIAFANERPPPLYLCIECANEIHRSQPNLNFHDILHPMQQVSLFCENKSCRSTEKQAVSVCFSMECASYNTNHPIRYCKPCHQLRHNTRRGLDHVFHTALSSAWKMDLETQSYLVESVVSLLQEASPMSLLSDNSSAKDGLHLLNVQSNVLELQTIGKSGSQEQGAVGVGAAANALALQELQEERLLLGRLGVWLLVSLCWPAPETHPDTMARLVSMLCNWYSSTATNLGQYLFKELTNRFIGFITLFRITRLRIRQLESAGERLKTEHVAPWLASACSQSHHQVLVSCLLPHPPECARVGGHWNSLTSRSSHLRAGLNRLLCLVPYEVVTPDIWSQVMPHWMEALVSDSHICMATSNNMPQVARYSAVPIVNETAAQISVLLSKLLDPEMTPLGFDSKTMYNFLSVRFNKTSASVQKQTLTWVQSHMNSAEFQTDSELNLSCCIMMLDIVLRQMQLQNMEKHCGIWSVLAADICKLLREMMVSPWVTSHRCDEKRGEECVFCESRILSSEDAEKGKKSSPESERKNELRPSDVVITMPFPEAHTVGNVLVNMPQIMTATVETVSEQLDLAAIIPAEKVVPAVARAVTLTETDVATATVQVLKATLVGENDQPIDVERSSENREFWETSVGKFWFSFDDLWRLLTAEHGHICEVCVPVLLHCVTLPCGLEVFWNVVQSAFHHHDWRQRFIAVERVTVIARFLDTTPLRNQQQLQSALANAFCYLISSMDDTNVQVAQRATLFLGTIHDRAIKALISCLETQFDCVIVDRPMVLQCLYQLHNSMSDRHILTWDFFLNRFDTIFIEAQINVEKLGDISYLRDLRNSDLKSDAFLRKLNRAHEALQSQSDTSNSGTASLAGATQGSIGSPTTNVTGAMVPPGGPIIKSLSSSFGTKWPYKRTMSAPASIIPRTEKIDKEKIYSRQYSAPVLKRRSSGRFGLEGHGAEEQLQALQAAGVGGSLGLAVLHRIVEFEECDSETVHLLIFLLMQFMSRPDQAFPSDDKNTAKAQNIVLRHLYLLLGYNLSERGFHVSPQRLRCSAVFRVFLANLPQLLDHNHLLGLLMLPTVLTLLIFCPAPAHHPAPFVMSHELATLPAAYSLWLLDPLARRNWLTALLVVLYKYQFNQPPFSSQIQLLIRVVLNTLDAQQHGCRRIPGTLVMGALPCRSRDVSQPSLGAAGIDPGPDTTCESPAGALTTSTAVVSQHNPLSPLYPAPPLSLEADETESELAAIPESPQSGSTLHQSIHQDIMNQADVMYEPRGANKITVSPIQVEEFESVSNLEIPNQERLLPIGSMGLSRESIPILVENLKMNLGLRDVEGTCGDRFKFELATTSSTRLNLGTIEHENYSGSYLDGSVSPRRLQKQPALLESPPSLVTTPQPVTQTDAHSATFYRAVTQERKPGQGNRQDDRQRCRQRKGGLFTIGQQPAVEQSFRPVGAWYPPTSHPVMVTESGVHGAGTDEREIPYRCAEDCVLERCSECGLIIEEYSDEEIGYCIIVLGTFIHAEPMLAAPLLPEILRIVAKITQNATYCWQAESKTHLPAGAISVAHQFLRCVLHQLAPNGVFTQIFQTQVPDTLRTQFFKSVAQALLDFNELNPIAPLQLMLESLGSKKTLPLDAVPNMAYNMSCYLECLQPLDSGFGPASQTWNILLTQFESLFRRIALALPSLDNMDSLFCIMISVLKIPGISGFKGILEPFSKILGYAIQNFPLKYQQLSDLCYLCSRAFVRERERLLLTRTVVLECVQALKFKSNIPDLNFVLLTNFILQSNCKGMNVGLNNDTLGGLVKSGLAQYLALEITRGNSRDNRAVSRYLPWLCNVPSVIQQGPREFLECMSHIRLLSWLLLGSLSHTALVGSGTNAHHGPSVSVPPSTTTQNICLVCQPIPQEVSCHIADHIQVILAGFVEQSKASVLHMSSLFHAFILCQLWTVYLEQNPNNALSNPESHSITMTILFDFWGKVTPCILTLVSHSKVLAEMVNLHFLSLLEALLECNSMVLSKLLPLWCPVIYTHQQQLPGNLQVRLQACRNLAPETAASEGDEPDDTTTSGHQQTTSSNGTQSPLNQANDSKKNPVNNQSNTHTTAAANPFLLKWLQRLQFKMSQIELQSSAAAQFYAIIII